MSVPVRYYCPRCGAVAALDREGYLSDKCVTPTPLDGWEYAAAYDDFEDSAEPRSADNSSGARRERSEGLDDANGGTVSGQSPREDADGVEIVCGAKETEDEGCGEVYYLNFVKYEDGQEVDPMDRSFVPPAVDGPSIPDHEEDDGPRFDFKP